RPPARGRRPDARLRRLDGTQGRGAAVSRPGRLDARADAPPRAGRIGPTDPAGLRDRPADPLPSHREGGERSVERGPLLRETAPDPPDGRRLDLDRPDRHPGRGETPYVDPGRPDQGRRAALHGRPPRPLSLPRVPTRGDPARRDYPTAAL